MTSDAVHDRAVRRFVLVALILPAVFVAVGVVIQLMLMPHMPATIAIHWNAAGEADGFAPSWTQPIMTVAFGLGIPGLMALISLPGLRRGDRGATYRFLGAMAAATSALTTVLFTWTFAAQAGAAAVVAMWPTVAVAFGIAIVVGVIAWFAQPKDDWSRSPAQAASPLDVTDGERIAWLRTTTMAPAAAITITVAALVVIGCAIGAWLAGAPAEVAWILSAVAVLVLAFAAASVAFHVRVDRGGLRVVSVLGIPRFRVPLAQIASAARVYVNPMGEFGGWGIRWSVDGRFGVVLRTGEAIEVTRTSGKRFVVTVDDAETGAALLEALVLRSSGAAR